MEPNLETDSAVDPPRWGLGDFLAGVLAGYALTTIVAAAWFASTGDEELSLLGQAFSQLGLWTGMVGACLVASRRKGSGRLRVDFGFWGRWSDLGIGLGAALAVQLLLLPALGIALRPLLGQPEVSGPVEEMIDKAQGVAFLGLILSVAICAPIVEELFFRGLLLRSLRRRMSDVWAVPVSALGFALPHVNPELPGTALLLVMISIGAFGAVLSVMAIRTGRLGPGIVTHAVFNLFTLLYVNFA